jgi:hypothetical protein
MGKKHRGRAMPRFSDFNDEELIARFTDDIIKDEVIFNDEVIVSSQVEDCDVERRFVWQHVVKGGEASAQACDLGNAEFDRKSKSDFSKHQVNYSATKYIKP